MGRVKSAKRNIAFGYVGQIATAIMSFILRNIFILYLSENLLGINSTYTNVLALLNMAELGIGKYALLLIIDLISAFLWIAGIQLTIYFFTPCHFIISECISKIITIFLTVIKKNNIADKSTIGICIVYGIIIICGLIYNEIIIINVGSLSNNTTKKILNRENKEKFFALQTFNDNSVDDMDTPC